MVPDADNGLMKIIPVEGDSDLDIEVFDIVLNKDETELIIGGLYNDKNSGPAGNATLGKKEGSQGANGAFLTSVELATLDQFSLLTSRYTEEFFKKFKGGHVGTNPAISDMSSLQILEDADGGLYMIGEQSYSVGRGGPELQDREIWEMKKDILVQYFSPEGKADWHARIDKNQEILESGPSGMKKCDPDLGSYISFIDKSGALNILYNPNARGGTYYGEPAESDLILRTISKGKETQKILATFSNDEARPLPGAGYIFQENSIKVFGKFRRGKNYKIGSITF
jgi:hypothetical protein